MANRTIKLYGKAYAETGQASLAANIGGNTVFSGNIPTATTPIDLEEEMLELCLMEIDDALVGNVRVELSVSGGDVAVQRMSINHNQAPGVYQKGTHIVTESSEEYTSFNDIYGNGEGAYHDKMAIRLNDTPVTTDSSYTGSWVMVIPADGQMSYDINIPEVPPPSAPL